MPVCQEEYKKTYLEFFRCQPSICNFVRVKQVKWGSALFRCQYLYFCTSKASKTEYHVVRVLQSTGEAAQIELMSPFLKVRSCPFFSSCLMGLRVSYETLKPVIDTAVGVCVCALARVFPSLQLCRGAVSAFAFLCLACD